MNQQTPKLFNLVTRQEVIVLLLTSLLFLLQPFKAIDQRVAVFILAFVGVCIVVTEKKLRKQSGFWQFLFVVFLLVTPGVFSIFGTYDLGETTKFILGAPMFFALGVTLYSLFCNRRTLDILMGIIAAASVFCVVDAFIQFIFGVDIFGVPPMGGLLTGPFSNAHMGTMLTVSMPVTLKWFEKYGWKVQLLYAICLGVVVFLSDKRVEWVTFLIGCLLFLFWAVKSKKLVLLLVPIFLFVISIAFFMSSGSKNQIERITKLSFTYESMDSILSGRMELYAMAINMGVNNPINGVGAGAYTASSEEFRSWPILLESKAFIQPHAHHPWLEVFAETGVIGILFLCFLICFLIYITVRSTRGFNLYYYPWLIVLILMFNPFNSMPPIFKTWWIPLVLLAIVAHLSDVEYEDRKIPAIL